ncbi:MAG TPA: antibiotic biosynthesis monooxygenase [Polyangiales bacterium]|jgi:heme-degrading monooxygenase HmoA|nr:antibiotic biosynthesis monooxygenase [Polyangiales bacterium]
MAQPSAKPSAKPSRVVIVFRAKLRDGLEDPRIEQVGTRMYELATQMPGFVSYAEYGSPDGEGVTLVEFESHETLAAWREHPEHKAAQELGKREWFSHYRISVCDLVRESSFSTDAE